ncbi:ubiquitin carboxyl-terminal hydrolase [Anaeramoeba flamelloides]|uniref:Ubiquitin carboxyl-terminal hydrolase n=1 Tax=Anaeramoeba flamelloides TaxID=1746091 RepID=A0ABQ8YN78_9EUKA|nr:ubiquitin carboxyl-terminal hydrolase [Anaeramoeba flamelloides]
MSLKTQKNNQSAKETYRHFKEMNLNHSELIVNEKWYMLEIDWMRSFERNLKQDFHTNKQEFKNQQPGLIDNSRLVIKKDGKFILKPNLKENTDFLFVHEKVWEFLIQRYGGGPAICRRVREVGKEKKKLFFLDLTVLSVYKSDNFSYKKHFQIKATLNIKVSQLFLLIGNKFCLPKEQFKLYHLRDLKKKGRQIEFSENCIYDVGIKKNTNLLFVTNSMLDTPNLNRKRNHSSMNENDPKQGTPKPSTPIEKVQGLVGLTNLGNTCYLNSSLQCLLNTVSLREYFLNGKDENSKNKNKTQNKNKKRKKNHQNKNNEKNKNKNKNQHLNSIILNNTNDKLVRSFAILLKDYWLGNSSILHPSKIKQLIGKFAIKFRGFAQHDAHEFLSFLLDGLHNDLNQPELNTDSIELDQNNNTQNVEKLAKQSWQNYKMKNNSIIVEQFQGLLQNKITCTNCSKTYCKFDPFMFLSLPIPTQQIMRHFLITVIPYDQSINNRTKYYIKSFKSKGYDGIVDKLSLLCNIKSNQLELYQTNKSQLIKQLNSSNIFQQSKSFNNPIIAYEIPEHNKRKSIIIPIHFHYSKESKDAKFSFPIKIILPLGKINSLLLHQILKKKLLELYPNLEQIYEKINLEKSAGQKNMKGKEGDHIEQNLKRKKINIQNNYGFQPESITPIFRIIFIKREFSGKMNIQFLDSNTIIKINSTIKIGIRFNPTFIESDQNFLQKMNFVQEHESVLLNENFLKTTNNNTTDSILLTKCIEMFTQEEKLSKNNTWDCSNCKKKTQPIKKIDIYKLPQNLIIHFKRFETSQFFSKKISSFVKFPLTLKISNILSNQKKTDYELYAIINHLGSVNNGHYIAYIKNDTLDKWFEFNDSRVSLISNIQKIVTNSAYVLFYRKMV